MSSRSNWKEEPSHTSLDAAAATATRKRGRPPTAGGASGSDEQWDRRQKPDLGPRFTNSSESGVTVDVDADLNGKTTDKGRPCSDSHRRPGAGEAGGRLRTSPARGCGFASGGGWARGHRPQREDWPGYVLALRAFFTHVVYSTNKKAEQYSKQITLMRTLKCKP